MAEPTEADLDKAIASAFWQANGPGWVLRYDKDGWMFQRDGGGRYPGLPEFEMELAITPGGPTLEWMPEAERAALAVFGGPVRTVENFSEIPLVEGVVY